MKKWLSFLLTVLLSLSLAACGQTYIVPGAEFRAGPGPAITQTAAPGTPAPETARPSEGPASTPAAGSESPEDLLPEDGSYTTKEDVALYIHLFDCLPGNFMTKKEARALGWSGGGLDDYAYGMCIGGDRFGNREGLLPNTEGRTWTECDIDTLHADDRGPKRIVFSNDGLIYYTPDHYGSFELLYGEE